MTEDRNIRSQDVSDSFFDLLAAVWRWLVLVAAIAVGTCLGITLFAILVLNRIGDSMHEEWSRVGTSLTSIQGP